MMCARVKDRKS
uniref:Uncharacterized protein n=1 Tax=Rhizophora mucronata TaxID=61149 RepID=A0A2P2J6Z4_RHIMU